MHTLTGYDETEAKEYQPFENPPSGGYIFEVVTVSDKAAGSGKAMITLGLDIAEGAHKGAFAKFPKPYRQLMYDENMNTSPYFKAMMEAFRKSNPPTRMGEVVFKQRDNSVGFNPARMTGLRIGGNLREAEYIKSDTRETKVGLEVDYLAPVQDVPAMKPRPLRKLQAGTGQPAARPAATGSRAPAPDDTLPF